MTCGLKLAKAVSVAKGERFAHRKVGRTPNEYVPVDYIHIRPASCRGKAGESVYDEGMGEIYKHCIEVLIHGI